MDEDEKREVIQFRREFISPEHDRYDTYSATSYVYIDEDGIEAELSISDGRHYGVNFDRSYRSSEYDNYLTVLDRLIAHITEHRDAFKAAWERVKVDGTLKESE